ncbi:MAG: amino acid ABC transporter permease [Firmicutes bacterium]|nr:amino acid ABC transporter permease [Bacillota bacterium]
MDFRWDLIIRSMPVLLEGAWVTVKLTTIAVTIGLVIGTFVGMARTSKNKIVYGIASVYVDFIRGTPLLVQIFLVYMGLPQLLGFPIPVWIAAITSLGVNSGAYVAEIVRAGIQSIDRGQVEAARSLGMTHRQTMRYIILPQAFKRIIPPLGNEFIAMLKDSSLVAVISLEELMRKGQIIQTRTFRPFEIYLAVAVLYLIMTLTISRLVAFAERRLKTE